MRGDLSLVGKMSLWLAGDAGQVALARTAGPGLRAAVDQHAAEIRDALGGQAATSCLLSNARGFTEAAVGRGWWPPHRRSPAAGLDLAGLEWESLRLAAVRPLYLQAQRLAPDM